MSLALTLILSGCQSPLLVFPGKALQGETTTTESFAFAARFKTLQLEVNREAPYSVNLRITVIDENLYIDAAPLRKWSGLLAENPNVRIKIAGKIYPAIAEPVKDPDIVRQFLQNRVVYRVSPRKP